MRFPPAIALSGVPALASAKSDRLWSILPRLHRPRPAFQMREDQPREVLEVAGVLNPAASFEQAGPDHFLRAPNYVAELFVTGVGHDMAVSNIAKAVGAPRLGLVDEFNVAGGLNIPPDLLGGDLRKNAAGDWEVDSRLVERVPGLSIPFCHYGMSAFGHFVLDGLMQIHLWERELRAGDAKLVHWHFPRPWMQPALDSLQLPAGAQHRLEGPVALLQKAGLSSALAAYGVYYPGAVSRGFFEWLRARFVVEPPSRPAKLYIRRSEAFGRTIANQAEVETLAVSHGFTVYVPEEDELPQKIRTFASAGQVLSPYGSSLTLAPLMTGPRRAIELLPDTYADPWFYRQATVHGLDYAPILHAAEPDGGFTADLERIDQVLRRLS